MRENTAHVQAQVAKLVIIIQGKLETLIVDVRPVQPARGALAQRGHRARFHQDVARVLQIVVERTAQPRVEHGEIQAEVMLRGRLPFQVRVAGLRAVITGRQRAALPGDVVGRAPVPIVDGALVVQRLVELEGRIGVDAGVTVLSPSVTELQ